MVKTKVKAPAKLILSGEHAVVRNHTALTVALNYFTFCEVSENPEQDNNQNNSGVELTIPQFNFSKLISWQELINLHIKLEHNYQRFTDGLINVNQILATPVELCWFSIIIFMMKSHKNINHSLKLKIDLNSEVPIGAGMGSSASIIVALLTGLNNFFNNNLCNNTIYQLALQAENLQHGYSSGVDIKTVLNNGVNYFYQANKQRSNSLLDLTLDNLNFYLINTGKPNSSTGECGARVKQNFNHQHIIWNEFLQCTELFKTNLEKQSEENIIHSIKTNHRLLSQLGVVPEKINQFILEIESQHGAAKICGAGSITGESAGMVLAIGNYSNLKTICDKYGFSIEKLAERIFYGE